MKMTIWAKLYLMRFSAIALACFFSASVFAKVNVSPLFISLSDAMSAVKQTQVESATAHLAQLEVDFSTFEGKTSSEGKQVSEAIHQAKNAPTLANLETLSKALYAFEKAQNPVDHNAQRQQFAKRVMPVFDAMQTAVTTRDLDAIHAAFKRFNNTWALNERPVRETSLGHYGQIETAMSLFRIALLSEPTQFDEMQAQLDSMKQALHAFKAGEVLQVKVAENAPQTLRDGIVLLERASEQLHASDVAKARSDLMLFIQQWPIFEGEVSTRDGALYSRVESELPLISAKGTQALAQLDSLIADLKTLKTGAYGVIDAMLILLREGLEALLIIMALLTTLNVAKQPRAKRAVYAGAGLGVMMSIVGAVALQQLFPAVSAGTNREILEGAVGIFAVAMMLFVGAWLHSKASISGWKRFLDQHVQKALTTGSLLSMCSLSFLSVFREGAETILFYAGMLPLISREDLLLGIGLALALLVIVATIMHFSSRKLPIPHLFKVMTVLIYALGFKILGVSIHALQLTNLLPTQVIETIPSIPSLGIFANTQVIGAQILYLVLIPVIAHYFKQK